MMMRGLRTLGLALIFGLAATAVQAVTLTPPGPIVAHEVYVASQTHTSEAFIDDIAITVGSSGIDVTVVLTNANNPSGSLPEGISFQWFDASNMPISSAIVGLGNALSIALAAGTNYILRIVGDFDGLATYNVTLTTTPLPPALILFGTALLGMTWLGRKKRHVSPA